MDCHFRDLLDFQSSEARWQINGKSKKWQSIRNYSYNKKFSTRFDDLGVIIMMKRCSVQQGKKKITVDQSKVHKKIDCSVFLGATHQWQINGKSRKWQSIKNYSYNKTFSTKVDDLGVIIMRKRCSIQQGEKR